MYLVWGREVYHDRDPLPKLRGREFQTDSWDMVFSVFFEHWVWCVVELGEEMCAEELRVWG